ncbi:collagen-like triple helix repeat-containing protein [Wolbachia endosymbiont of Tettigetta isshikii]|uniref:collagen-like triple helix repeat-containing protein n=1 Tax=Wolbachia endosymbiont of Tettigetta isshikii TaxID=3239093 RepID=UPI003980F003
MLENSNIRKVLPELEIDDSVNLDKRKLNCLISKMYNADLVQVAQELVTNKKDELGQAVLEAKNGDEEILVTKVTGNQGLQNAVADNLKGDRNFKDSVKGDSGPRGPQGNPGPAGETGESPSAAAVAAQLLTDANKNTLVTEVASDKGLQEAIAGNQVLKDAVTTALSSDDGSHNIV